MNSILKKLYIAGVFFLLPLGAFAQDEGFDEGEGDGDDVNDEVAVPIDGAIVPMLMAGCALGFVLLRKGEKFQTVK